MPHAKINGAKLWYEEFGRDQFAAGPVLLLHHGYTASRVNWMPVAQRLKQHFHIVVMECRGSGASEHTADGYSLEQYSEDVLGLMDKLALSRVSFAGHSMGGGIGYLLALNHPTRLDNLILMAPIPAAGIGDIPDAIRAERIAERQRGDHQALLERYQAMRFRPDVETDAWFNDRVKHILSVSDGHFVQSAESMQALNVENRLSELNTPTLMLAGAVDSLLPANLNDFLRLPNATLEVISRAGHEVAIHEPDRVSEVITEFMTHGVVTHASLLASLDPDTNQH